MNPSIPKNNQSKNKTVKAIDLRKIIASKNPGLLKILPKFILNYIKKIIHEDDLNDFLKNYGQLVGLDFIAQGLKEIGIKADFTGEENIINGNRQIVASNHPLGGPDGVALMHVIGKFRTDINFIVNDLLLNLEGLKHLFIPVNKHGNNPKEAIKIMNKVYESNNLVITFPFGLVSRKRKGKIKDLEWKKSFITKAKQFERDVIPVHISGKNSSFFYQLANFRKFLKIRANIEMFFLVNEMFKQKNNTLLITFGKPISYKVFDNRFTDLQWAEKVRQHVYIIKNNPKADFIIE